MGAPNISASSSLDRLKALDALPDLASQLQEAKQLCDNRARAEMILKWLMTKLKTSDEARKNDSSWTLCASTVRLVPAQRIAVLSHGLLPAIQQTWAASDVSDATIRAIARLFGLLLGLRKGADGAAIKSLLSVKGDTAAMMCGDWYRHVYHNFSQGGETSVIAVEGLLEPALQLWELRKHSEEDDTSFNKHCLAPVLLLLAQLRNASIPTSAKRKRGHDLAVPTPTRSYEHALESLLARHTILPARTVFSRKHEQQARRLQPGQRKMLLQPAIKERLSSLMELIESGTSGTPLINSLWLVLDVAMRSVSTPTPRHRLAERPWIEAIFAALSDCVASQGRPLINRILIDLLEIVRRNGAGHTALSAHTLTGLIKQHAITESASNKDVDWHLVAKVVELDPDVLTNTSLSEQLFDAISMDTDHQSSPPATLWRDDIIVPTMKAYARGRSLFVFVDMWHKQLLRPRSTKQPCVWESLSAPFADILEEYALAEQIIAQIDRFSVPVSAALEAESKLTNAEVESTLIANIILLESLLSGARSDGLISSLQDKLHAILHNSIDLASLKGFKSTIAMSAHYWSLLTRAFQLWFPFWATRQDDSTAVEREGVALLASKALKHALAQCSSSGTDETRSHSLDTARAARGFVASICACFQHYGGEDGCAGQCEKAVEHIVKHKVGAASVLVRRQALLSSLKPSACKELLSSSSLLTVDAGVEDYSTSTPIEALLDSSRGSSKQRIYEDVVSTLLAKLKDSEDELRLLSTLAGMDMLSIEQVQRVEILDSVSQLREVPQGPDGVVRLQARFAVLLKLLALPCQNALLLTDPSTIWKLTSLVELPRVKADNPDNDTSQLEPLANVDLVEQIARRVLKSLLATQDSQKSQTTLVGLSQLIKDAIKAGAKSGKLTAYDGQLAFIRVAITMIETSAKDDIKKRLVYRASKTAKLYLDTLLAECSSVSGDKGAQLTRDHGICAISALQALLAAPNSFIELSGIDSADYTKRLYKSASQLASPSRVLDDQILQSRLLAVCFQVLCRRAPGKKNLTAVAEDVLQRDLKPRDLVTVLLAYEESFKQADAEWKLTAITTRTKSSSSFLQQAVIRALTREDAEAIPSAKDIVSHTLQAATSSETPLAARRTALQTLTLVFKDKAFLTTQHTIEQTLSGLQEMFSSSHAADVGAIYLDICQVLTVILAQHRSRLQGRFHLVIGALQQLTAHLFSDSKAGVHQARSLAKLLESFCNPPALRYRKGGKPSELVDEAKKAQAHAGQFAQYLLHFYCSCVLTGSLGECVREALLPGLYAMIEAMEAYNEDGVKVLSSAASNSERAVLRSVYEDWKRFGKWEGV